MRIAAVESSEIGAVDRALCGLADRLLADGWRVVGTVQTNTEAPGQRHCDMDVRILPDGPMVRINQRLGMHADGCRLDAGALENAVAAVALRLDAGADALIVNKFGKHEAEGRGFRTLIAEALARGIPVICGVNDLNRAAFDAFTAGIAEPVAARPADILAWLHAARLENVA